MYRRILVPVDGSDASNLALKEALKLADDHHSVLRLVHVVDPTSVHALLEGPYVVGYQKLLDAAGQKVIDDCSAIVRGAGIKFDAASIAIAKRGQRIYDVIDEEAGRWQADVIVVGTHGRRGIRHLLLGSVAEGLTRVATKPVLLVPRSASSI